MDARSLLQRVLHAVREAADPRPAVARTLASEPELGEVDVLAIGKASPPMLASAVRVLGARADGAIRRALVTCPPELAADAALVLPRAIVLSCDHPLPTPRNLRAAALVRDFVASVPGQRTLLVLLSGGASAHLALPAGEVTLEDLAQVTRELQRSGADIRELNCVRKHCELLKGGNLARLTTAKDVLCLTVSDVIGDPLDVIASGPFHPDPGIYAQASGVLEARGVDVPRVREHLRLGALGRFPETPKSPSDFAARVRTRVIASNVRAASDAAQVLTREGLVPVVRTGVEGEASDVALDACARLRALPSPGAVVVGGEWTVRVGAGPGKGGPSQEWALAAAISLEESLAGGWGLLGYSTDGIDGPTDAAGALLTATDLQGADIEKLREFLRRHDSTPALDSLGCLLRTGPTGTNVNHVGVLVRGAG